MLSLVLPAFVGAVTGALAGGLLAWWLLSRGHPDQTVPIPPNPWLDAEIDQAATSWAMAHGRPEAAGMMADKLHLLHDLGQRRKWWR
jgi:hypothetical protein